MRRKEEKMSYEGSLLLRGSNYASVIVGEEEEEEEEGGEISRSCTT